MSGALSRVTGEAVGDYTINQGALKSTNNYTISYTTATFKITKASFNKANLTAAQKPAAKSLTYTAAAQALLTAPTGTLPTGYTIQYKLSTASAYSTTIPSATAAGPYTVNVLYKGDANHADVQGDNIAVTIGKATLTVKAEAKSKV